MVKIWFDEWFALPSVWMCLMSCAIWIIRPAKCKHWLLIGKCPELKVTGFSFGCMQTKCSQTYCCCVTVIKTWIQNNWSVAQRLVLCSMTANTFRSNSALLTIVMTTAGTAAWFVVLLLCSTTSLALMPGRHNVCVLYVWRQCSCCTNCVHVA
jgi:hypothetical protein